jgi:hypothetical protein
VDEPDYQVQPDWVMVGAPHGEQVALYASKELTRAQLVTEMVKAPTYADLFGPMLVPPRYEHTVSVVMLTYVVMVGNTYGDCLAGLMRIWSPDPDAAEIAPMLQLPGGGRP